MLESINPVKSLAEPGAECRITTVSIFIASMVLMVSRSVSPLEALLPDLLKFMLSAERRFSASSNDIRVLVDDS